MITSERLVFLIRISTSKFTNPILIKDLIKMINISRANFTPVKKILLDNNLAVEHQSYGNAKLLSINLSKLDSFIINSDIYQMIAKYVKFKDPLTWRI